MSGLFHLCRKNISEESTHAYKEDETLFKKVPMDLDRIPTLPAPLPEMPQGEGLRDCSRAGRTESAQAQIASVTRHRNL
jgi:hypothetical protein